MPKTMAEQFVELETLIYDFDPNAQEDQEGDVHCTTFSDGSKVYSDPGDTRAGRPMRIWTA